MSKKESRPGFGKILEAWVPPDEAGEPVGCVATSFTFSPAFFEEECLSRFLHLDTDPNEDGASYLVEREEKLAQVVCAAALVDQHHCKGNRNLRWDLFSPRLSSGILHAKIALLHWAQLVRVIISSANITEDGYRRNQEVFGVLDYRPGGEAPLNCLAQTVEFLRETARYSRIGSESVSAALTRWETFLDKVAGIPQEWGTGQEQYDRNAVRIHPLFVGPGRANAFETLSENWPGGGPPNDARIVSPFFDPPANNNGPAERLWENLRRRGEAHVSFFVSAEEIPGEEGLFVHAPESLRSVQPTGRPNVSTEFFRVDLEANRSLHAKGVWLANDRWISYMIGSSNFTSAGLGLSQNPNLEANLVYTVNFTRNRKAYNLLEKSFPSGYPIDPKCPLKWQPCPDTGEDAPGDDLPLPRTFGSATYDCDEKQKATITFTFAENPPSGWILLLDENEEVFFSEMSWQEKGRPFTIVLPWELAHPPSGFWVRWKDSNGRAWWPVNIASTSSLPPPEELKDLPLEILIEILTSTRPLHIVLSEYPKRKKNGSPVVAEVDPHKRVDTSRFLMQRTRHVSYALNALRERLERPVTTEECLRWRLRGPVGVMAVANAINKDAESDEERAFLLSELALELYRTTPHSALGCLPPDQVRKEIKGILLEIKSRIPASTLEKVDNLRSYVENVFEDILK